MGSHYAYSTPEDWFNEAHCLNCSTVFRKTGKGEPEVLQCRVWFQWINQVVLCVCGRWGRRKERGLGFKLWCSNFGCKLVVCEFILGYFGNLIKFYIYASYGVFWASYSHGFNFAETRRRSSSAVSLTLWRLVPRCRWQQWQYAIYIATHTTHFVPEGVKQNLKNPIQLVLYCLKYRTWPLVLGSV